MFVKLVKSSSNKKSSFVQVKPRESYLKKYCNPKKSQGLELPHIKLYGRQILEVQTHIYTQSHIHTHTCMHTYIYIHTLCDYLCVYIQGLKLLHDAGIFFGHLHTSNVLVDDGVCRLMDVENGMLGVPSALRPAFTQFRKINVCAHTDSVWISLIS